MCTYQACTFTGREYTWELQPLLSRDCKSVRAQTQIVETIQRNRGCSWLTWRLVWHPHRYGGGLSWYLSLSFFSISSLVVLSEPQALLTSQTARQVQCGISLLMTGMTLSFQRFFYGFVTMVPAMASKPVPGTKCLFSRNSRPWVLKGVSEPSPGFSRQQVYNKELLKFH